ncbi:MAG: cytochrome-c peroxidase, partial [Chitinophagaceae bacterium]
MQKNIIATIFAFVGVISLSQCKKTTDATVSDSFTAIAAAFGVNINPQNPYNYASQTKPAYITKDNTAGNIIINAKATIGRVLFYDKQLSINNTVSCASCHKQEFAFSDTALVSKGVEGGLTGRHSMRLVNSRFGTEMRFFWDERAASLEAQTTQPIQDHAEMGFSGKEGRPNFATLLTKLKAVGYYNELFKWAYNDTEITETRMQECLSQFIRSIQSFDSKYDAGRAAVNNDGQNFPNFTALENQGKSLFLQPPAFDGLGRRIGGGLGCGGCHRAPEFDIDPNSGNNGIVAVANSLAGIDVNNTRTPSLRDITNNAGAVNTAFMHTGSLKSLEAVIDHYNNNNRVAGNNRLDP